MADRIIKPDNTHDLVLQNNDGSSKMELNEDQTVKVITGSDDGENFTVNTSQLVVEGDSGNVGIGTTSPASDAHLQVVADGAAEMATIDVNGAGSAADSGSQIRLARVGTTYCHIRVRNNDDIGDANSIIIGDSNMSNGVYMNQDVSGWTNFTSDERRKTDWAMFVNAIEKINTLTKIGVYYNMDPTTKEKTSPDLPQVGVSAQEVKAILPEAVDENVFDHLKSDENPEGKFLSLRYDDLFCLALKAIQELSAKVTALENA